MCAKEISLFRPLQDVTFRSVFCSLFHEIVCWQRFLLTFATALKENMRVQGRNKLDNWGGGGGLIFIYSGSGQLISFEIDCFYGV